MNNGVSKQLDAVLRAITIVSPTAISFADELPVPVHPPGPGPPPPGQFGHTGNPLLEALENVLYRRCYCQAVTSPPPEQHTDPPPPEFLEQLSHANQGHSRWDPWWRIVHADQGGMVRVEKGERQRSAMPGQFLLTDRPGMAPQVGHMVSLHVAVESHHLMEGFFFVFGETLGSELDEFATVRIYFNITADGAPALVETLSRELNHCRAPFHMKCMTQPAGYARTDAAVLYVPWRYFQPAVQVIGDFSDALASQLEPAVPLFSKRLADGIAVAEDPNTGESFGQHRCRLVAEGIIAAWQQGDQSPAGRFEAVRRRFAASGLDLNRPHLNAGSVDVYDVPQFSGVAL